MPTNGISILVAAVLVAPMGASGQEGLIALRGATIHTAAGAPIVNGTIVMRNGRIEALGGLSTVPAGAQVIDVSGKTIIPGMMDNHSHIGFDNRDVNERGTRFAPRYRISDVLSPDERYWNDAVEGGVTTVVTGPGSGSVSSGQAAVVKTWGASLEQRLLKERGGLKIAMGRKSGDQAPQSSMAVTSFLREQFLKAQEYRATRKRWEDGGRRGPPAPVDLDLDVLARVLAGEDRVRSHVHSAHDILSILRLKDEFGFDLTLHHATEAYKVADEIAKRKVHVVGLPLFLRIGIGEQVMSSPALLVQKGILFAFHTDDPVIDSKYQRYNGSLAIRYGLPEAEALKALTINAAQIAGVADRVGSLEVGKDADLVVLDGPWYELTTRIDLVFVNGRKAYDRVEKEARQ